MAIMIMAILDHIHKAPRDYLYGRIKGTSTAHPGFCLGGGSKKILLSQIN